jgi:hypothetical protein
VVTSLHENKKTAQRQSASPHHHATPSALTHWAHSLVPRVSILRYGGSLYLAGCEQQRDEAALGIVEEKGEKGKIPLGLHIHHDDARSFSLCEMKRLPSGANINVRMPPAHRRVVSIIKSSLQTVSPRHYHSHPSTSQLDTPGPLFELHTWPCVRSPSATRTANAHDGCSPSARPSP